MNVPVFWPMAMAALLFEEGTEIYAKNLKFVDEEMKIHDDLRPKLATRNKVRLDLRTMVLREHWCRVQAVRHQAQALEACHPSAT